MSSDRPRVLVAVRAPCDGLDNAAVLVAVERLAKADPGLLEPTESLSEVGAEGLMVNGVRVPLKDAKPLPSSD